MNVDDPLQLSLDTILSASRLMGHALEDRSCIRNSQDPHLVEMLQLSAKAPLQNTAQQSLFAVAPLDILVSDGPAGKQFHVVEINGTGIGGLTNLTTNSIASILESLSQIARSHWEPSAMYLVAISGKESDQSPRLNRLIHEKLLFAEALKDGLEIRGDRPRIVTMPDLIDNPEKVQVGHPIIVLGYIKEFLTHLNVEQEGRLTLFGRPVSGAVNDRFCQNVIDHFDGRIDLRRFATINRCFLAGSDKGIAYGLMNDFLQQFPTSCAPSEVRYEHAVNRNQLISGVLRWMSEGRQTVIKPHGTGIGHGIEFFLSPEEREEDVVERIDRSIQMTEQYYRVPGGAFPYTLCEFIDACTIQQPGHPLLDHKYELRIVVYRDQMTLKAFPSIAKISGFRYDPAKPDRSSLINNITASSVEHQKAGVEYMLPLSNRDTLEVLGLSIDDLRCACQMSTQFVRFMLDRLQEHPERFGLPASAVPQAPEEDLVYAQSRIA